MSLPTFMMNFVPMAEDFSATLYHINTMFVLATRQSSNIFGEAVLGPPQPAAPGATALLYSPLPSYIIAML